MNKLGGDGGSNREALRRVGVECMGEVTLSVSARACVCMYVMCARVYEFNEGTLSRWKGMEVENGWMNGWMHEGQIVEGRGVMREYWLPREGECFWGERVD